MMWTWNGIVRRGGRDGHAHGRLDWAVPLLGIALAGVGALTAQEPAAPPAVDSLAVRIDAVVDAAQLVPAAPPASDAEFIRRVSLDLVGRIPSVGQTRAFLDDASPTKRAALVDALLARPEYVRHLAQFFDVTLMERRPDKQVPSPEWQAYLYASVKANKPFDQLAREILSAETEQNPDPAMRPAAKFYLDREAEANLLTRDVARIFFGKDFQCNQCHDHPLVGDYLQSDYYGLFACFQRTSLFTDKEKKVWLAEKADGDPTYQSVFVPDDTPHTATPRLPDGPPLVEPAFAKGDEYLVAPADNVRHVPKHSRRALLAASATDGKNVAFARNIANRLWAHMLGRGLVEPVDMHHGDNPPSNPELLELLTREIVALKFDTREFLRQIALSRTYQRSIDLPSDLRERTPDVVARIAEFEAEVAASSAALEAARTAAQAAAAELEKVRAATEPQLAELSKARAAAAAAQAAVDTAATALATAEGDATAKQDIAQALAAASMAAKAAADKLASDQELAQAAEKFRTKAEQATAEAAAAQATLAQRKTEKETAAGALEPARAALEAATTAAAPAEQQRAAAEAQQVAADGELRQKRLAAQGANAKLVDARALAAYQEAVGRVEASRAAADKLATEVAGLVAPVAEKITQATTQIAEAEAAYKAAEQNVTAAATALAAADTDVAAKKQTGDVIAEALAKTSAAQEKLPGDAELGQAVALLKSKAEKSTAEVAAAEQARTAAQQQHAGAQTQVAAAQQMLDARRGEAAALEAERARIKAPADQALAAVDADSVAMTAARAGLVERAEPRLTIAALKQLSPESLAWSLMQATGVVDATRATVETEWLAAHQGTDVAALDAAQQTARAFEIEQALFEKLKAVQAQFVSLFAAPPGQPQNTFQATVDQALFLANNGTLKGWLAPAGQNLTARLIALAEPAQVAEELYLSVLSRHPTEAETAELAALLTARPSERQQIVTEFAWALVCSSEFRFNH